MVLGAEDMNWLSKTQGVKSGQYQSRLVGLTFATISLCSAFSVFADAALTDSTISTTLAELAYARKIADLDGWPETCARAELLNDMGLSAISGRGVEAAKLESNEAGNGNFAVLLWDERGNGNKRPAGHRIEANAGFQAVNSSINLTDNRR
jgi:hypothetical protein